MSRFSNEMRRALLELEGDLDHQVLTWGGNEYICVPKKSTAELSLSIGGFSPTANITFILRREQFGVDIPKAKQFVSSGEGRFIIDTVNESADHSFIRLDCNIAAGGV